MITDLASNYNILLNLEQGMMLLIKKYVEIRKAYFKVKETIMIGVQQSLLYHFLSLSSNLIHQATIQASQLTNTMGILITIGSRKLLLVISS